MKEKTFRLLLGLALLAALYFEAPYAIYAIIALLVFEGLTNWRVTLLLARARQRPNGLNDTQEFHVEPVCAISFEAERALRLIVAGLLVSSFVLYHWLWFLPWFIGFALIGAGLSGICPMVITLRKLGFR
jgi:hypothetical protein